MKSIDPENSIYREKEECKSIFWISSPSHTLHLGRIAFESRIIVNTTCNFFCSNTHTFKSWHMPNYFLLFFLIIITYHNLFYYYYLYNFYFYYYYFILLLLITNIDMQFWNIYKYIILYYNNIIYNISFLSI